MSRINFLGFPTIKQFSLLFVALRLQSSFLCWILPADKVTHILVRFCLHVLVFLIKPGGSVSYTIYLYFFFLPSTSVSFLLFPWPLSIPQILPYESVWLAVCCCQGACEGDSSRQTGPGSGRPAPTTGKEEILEDSTKATAALCLPTFIL